MKKQILIIDDDQHIQTALHFAFRDLEFNLVSAFSIAEAKNLLLENNFDCILLDLMLPDGYGIDLLKDIRQNMNYTPVICFSTQDDETSKVLGLGIGADDYVTKPFHFEFLKSKINALIRRNIHYSTQQHHTNQQFYFDNITMNIYKDKTPIDLTSKELSLLKLFIDHPNQVFSKEHLYTSIWKQDIIDDNTITVYIKRLRSKIEIDPANPIHLITVWGIGYKFIDNPK